MCAYQNPKRIAQGGSSSVGPAWYGSGQDGVLNTTGNVTLLAANGDSTSTIMQYESLTVNSGHTLSAGFRTRALVIYVRGSAVINGSITMGNGAAAAASVINLTRYDVNGLTGTTCEPANTVNFTTPAAGAAGGVSDGTFNVIVNGAAGTGGQTGGGGAGQGGGGLGLGSGGNGATGTAYSGGPGGGSASYNAGGTNGTAGGANGGAGGASGLSDGSYYAGGGAGNPGGVGTDSGANNGLDGTGGTLILIVGGNLTIGGSSVISASGSAGGSCLQASGYRLGGGGSGAGRVIILYAGTLSNSGSIVATGGAGGTGATSNGGAGGAGSVTSPTKVG